MKVICINVENCNAKEKKDCPHVLPHDWIEEECEPADCHIVTSDGDSLVLDSGCISVNKNDKRFSANKFIKNKSLIDYKILASSARDNLVTEVKECMRTGWVLQGSAFFSNKYCQTMVKYE